MIAHIQTIGFAVAVLIINLQLPAQFVHPGTFNTRAQLDEIKQRVAKGVQPQKNAYDQLKSSKWGNKGWKPHPVSTVEVGFYNDPMINYNEVLDDGRAASALALLWYISGDEGYAKTAMAILDAQAGKLASIKGGNKDLYAGWTGHSYARAADILKHTYKGWSSSTETKLKDMFKRVYYPRLKSYKGYENNWNAIMQQSMMAIAVFCDDKEMFDKQVGYTKKLIGVYIFPSGECRETCRDLAHALMGVAHLTRCCEIAWNQGIDLYKELNNRVLKGMEYEARCILKWDRPKPTCDNGVGKWNNPNATWSKRANEKPAGWEMCYNHYFNRKGIDNKYVKKMAESVRIDGMCRWGEGMASLTHAGIGNVKGSPTRTILKPLSARINQAEDRYTIMYTTTGRRAGVTAMQPKELVSTGIFLFSDRNGKIRKRSLGK